TRYNEYVMTGLRTIWGCDRRTLRQIGAGFETLFLEKAQTFIQKGWLEEKAPGVFILTPAGKLFSDHIAMELFV
ncbi:MAG: coproporphyrinogen III oxidase, partial [Bacteroidetes bacterium]